ncbi:class I SAM-dependent methyltransferase [Myroides odoratimimus]|uniref:class I SAM-dependent methyltransferase n=1 Tax=Myroides odoratimimus TaxID=76832 RepID=UPI001CE0934A|nr:class I SAM-dependent methyltransferase [Myroides odoratimimus]
MEDQLYQNVDLVQFYDYDNLWENEERYVQLAEKVKSVLDLGCGTGRLASALAEKGKDVVGVEYAQAMLEKAKKRSSEVKWVQGDARTIRLEQKFDLIILSGHVFQVFLTKEDRLAVLETIKVHLNEGGRYIFDSRLL